jgi:hypothetical protein
MAYIKCKSTCPHGRDCQCNGTVKHALHICDAPLCACHSAERYGAVLTYAPSVQDTPVRLVNAAEVAALQGVGE